MESEADNPFAAPQVPSDDDQANWSVAERVRHSHINHEANIKSIGSVYLLCGGLCFVVCIVIYNMGSAGFRTTTTEWKMWIAIFGVLSVFQLVVAMGVSYLRPWARTPAIVLSILTTVGVPIGTVLGPYFLYLLMSAKGQTVFSEEYRSIISETPLIKVRTPLIAWIVLGCFLLAIASGILYSMMN